MKFYVVNNQQGEIIGCEYTVADAHALAYQTVEDGEGYDITRVECSITRDTVRRLLGNLGGYATKTELVLSRTRQ